MSAPAAAPRTRGCQPRTLASRRRSVEAAITAMRQRLGEPLSLHAIARTAASSPYHFDRIFRDVTGMPPFRYLAALRLDAARRLLLTTPFSATSICFEVGYNSVGSFTRQFSEAVGLPPQRLRQFASAGTEAAVLAHARDAEPEIGTAPPEQGVGGRIVAPEGFEGVVMVGVFSTPLPRGRPEACAFLRGPGCFRTAPVADGEYHVFAAGIPAADAERLPAEGEILRSTSGPVEVRNGRVEDLELTLRAPSPIDPPILISLPVLMAERFSRVRGGGSA
jgi:AraC family transcriptional regulator